MASSRSESLRHSNSPASRTVTVCVVDSRAGDYQGWETLAESHGVQLKFLADAREALRFSRTNTVALWVINTRLPGISGPELCGMLRGRCRSPIYLVADHYSVAVEQTAWQAGPTLFGFKPAHHQWLEHWIRARSMGARCGPLQAMGVLAS